MVGQVALAHHSASHIDHGFSQELTASYNDHSNHKQDHHKKKHECPECLLTKSLQSAFYNAPVTLSFTAQGEVLTTTQQSLTIAVNRYKANPPRAPPAFLI